MKRTILKTLLPLALMAGSSNMLLAADGDLDTSFGGDGKVTTNAGSSYTGAMGVAIQNDGKILAAGDSYTNSTDKDDFVLLRYNPNGSLDTTFGSNGKVWTNFNGDGYRDYGRCIAIQNDGKIVMAGDTHNDYGPGDFALARYNPEDGSLDTTFDVDGMVVTNLGSSDAISSIVILESGKILVGGVSNQNFALVRYDSNGSVDTTFGSSGKVITDFGGQDSASDIAIQNDGKIVAAGTTDHGSYAFDFALARYDSNGSLDTTFGTDGKVITDFGPNGDRGYSVVIQSDGKIVVAGESGKTSTPSYSYFALARYESDGSLDTTFDTDGKVTTDFGASVPHDKARSVAIQNSGKIVVAGTGNSDFALARYDQDDGSLDMTFGSDGKVTTDFNGGGDGARSVVIQSDGNIIAAGTAERTPGAYYGYFALARYESAPCQEGYRLKQGENICIPGTPEPDPGPYPARPSNDFVQGDVSETGSRDADPGYQGDYPTLCRDGQEQGAYSCAG